VVPRSSPCWMRITGCDDVSLICHLVATKLIDVA
jgi:hypothetical protein